MCLARSVDCRIWGRYHCRFLGLFVVPSACFALLLLLELAPMLTIPPRLKAYTCMCYDEIQRHDTSQIAPAPTPAVLQIVILFPLLGPPASSSRYKFAAEPSSASSNHMQPASVAGWIVPGVPASLLGCAKYLANSTCGVVRTNAGGRFSSGQQCQRLSGSLDVLSTFSVLSSSLIS